MQTFIVNRLFLERQNISNGALYIVVVYYIGYFAKKILFEYIEF
jgi:hypothetical protein